MSLADELNMQPFTVVLRLQCLQEAFKRKYSDTFVFTACAFPAGSEKQAIALSPCFPAHQATGQLSACRFHPTNA